MPPRKTAKNPKDLGLIALSYRIPPEHHDILRLASFYAGKKIGSYCHGVIIDYLDGVREGREDLPTLPPFYGRPEYDGERSIVGHTHVTKEYHDRLRIAAFKSGRRMSRFVRDLIVAQLDRWAAQRYQRPVS